MSDQRDLNRQEQKRLLGVARQTISQLVRGRPIRQEPADMPGLEFPCGAFVTLHKQGQLRGCIGSFVSDNPLVQTVQEMARAAASQDPRFRPVSPDELDNLDLEISVLSPLRPIDDPNQIKVGVHGIYIINPRGRGVLLPQVATEQGWDRQTFLNHTCLKAGLTPNCWKDPDTQILVFTAQVFGEKEFEGEEG